ncbi:MAG: SPASM domain-containing protein, partial [Peptococcaceae bacterium]|nr:SPASM domain-containing protein [Peptococcaceae bacterium]
GTLIDLAKAKRIKELGASYVGISLDGLDETNDSFRGRKGAFLAALEGIRNCREVGQKTGLRFTINPSNYHELDNIFDLVESEGIPRICFYHLVYSGRGINMLEEDISHQQTRAALELIIRRTEKLIKKGRPVEVLTVDNHCDGVYLYLKLVKENSPLAGEVLNLLKINGGNRSGIAFGQIDWSGNVHPDQFTAEHILGNAVERKFSEIWSDTSNPILAGLKNRSALLKGRCSKCKWLSICNGNFRARAEAVYGDFWAQDPACYLTDEEIGIY